MSYGVYPGCHIGEMITGRGELTKIGAVKIRNGDPYLAGP